MDTRVAYAGPVSAYGSQNDPMIGKLIGGSTSSAEAWRYSKSRTLRGGVDVSGDNSCADHIVAWKLRHALNLDNVPAGPDADSNSDNIIYTEDTLDGFEHPTCFDTEGQGDHVAIGNDLPNTHPVGSDE